MKVLHINENSDIDKEFTSRFVGVNKETRQEFKNTGCLLIISVGQLYHEGEKFKAAIKLVNKSFAFCDILVSDTLQKYTIYLDNKDKNEDELYILAKKAGDDWIERNMQYISTLTIPYHISRWDEWLVKDKYNFYHEKVRELYNSNITYKNLVDEVAYDFLSRRNYLNDKDEQSAFDSSLKYLLEESAVTCLFEGLYKFCVYPSDLHMISTCNKLIHGNNAQSKMINYRVDKPSHNSLNEFKALNQKYIAANHVLNHAPGHIYWKNLEGIYLGSNIEHAKYLGFSSPSDIIGKTDEELIGKENAAAVYETDLKVMTTDIENIIEEYDNNSNKWFLSKKVPLKDKDNKIIGLLGTSIDITKQKTLELNLENATRELKYALAAKTDFLNNMSHEMRTPVSGFSAISEGLVDNWDILTDDKKFKYVQDIANSANRLSSLINNLLDLSTFIANKMYLNFTKTSINQLIEDVIKEAEILYANDKLINVNFSPDKQISAVIDSEWIKQVFHHLLSNALKYDTDNGLIAIDIDKLDDSLHFSITDTGVGIPESELKDIFIPFTESSRTKTRAGGKGLGLTICKKIIEAHNGHIWAENNSTKGSTFHFRIPINHE